MLKPRPDEYEEHKALYIKTLKRLPPKERAAWVVDEALSALAENSLRKPFALREAFDEVVVQDPNLSAGLRGNLRVASNTIDHCLDRVIVRSVLHYLRFETAPLLRSIAAKRNVTSKQALKGLESNLKLAQERLNELADLGLVRKIQRTGSEIYWQLQPRGLAAIFEIEKNPLYAPFRIPGDSPALEGNSRLVQSLRARMQTRGRTSVGR